MSPLIGIGASLLGGWLGKRGGKKVEEATGIPLQKVLAPVLATIGAGGSVAVPEMAAGDVPSLATLAGMGAPIATYAIVAHTLLKNFKEFVEAVVKLVKAWRGQ